ncbi:latent-transforming growth factor beta-binding protein 3-like [Stylophora pistillata]|uniref:Latent-transforming growth factor beta-binding protein 1 n=1 Tax=Stylophora pistillata TaxID=50429 RepID=A0A2B4RVW0_STYPI|nr:latent-transforming growth factor beta-binding protein 3-like [Stylophora pistillata]PFX20375.1 Latent-transforming growth factor beta-binding protein 1 [Stylophora pistillata]
MAIFTTSLILLCFLGSSVAVEAEKCGAVLNNETGVITSPNYPNNYPNGVTCRWKISPQKSHVNITIEDFLLEGSSTCEAFDFVEIKVKKGTYNNERIAVCGSLTPRVLSIKLDGESVEITFKTDVNVNARGFKISYRSFDVDPCVNKNGGCSHTCNLVKGKRECSCPDGYKLGYDSQTCKGVNNCYFVGRRRCPYSSKSTCKDLGFGNTTCVCWNGYKKDFVDGVCRDINECNEDPNRCGVGVCNNRIGYYYCTCPKGYRTGYKDGKQTCQDKDECSSYRPPYCGEARCVNTPGSYVCQCKPGYKFNETSKTCEDDDECAASSSGCDQVCSNTNGSFSCSCHPGFFLDSNGKTCRDVKIEGLGLVNKDKACHGESLRMSCKDPLDSLIIYEAKFGDTGDLTICPYKHFIAQVDSKGPDTLPCYENVTKKIESLCGWRSTCEVKAESALSRLCRGPNNHLSVMYSCGKPLKCPALPKPDKCVAPVNNECKSDKDCPPAKMCCFDGCQDVCSKPVMYTSGS